MPFELRHLRAFVHLAETKHFGVTAERLGITQPALSQTIKGLEEALGVVLLDRRSRRISLTDAGEIFLAEAIATMVQADRAERIGKRTGRGQAGLVEIGYVGSAPFSPVFGRIISSFREKFVGLSLRMTQLPSMVQMDRIAQSSLDFGFVRTPLGGAAAGRDHPQCSTCRYRFAVPVRSASTSRTRRRNRARACHSTKAFRPKARHFPN
jgi:DNA-binding transcriptional LysR family regulator